MLDYNKICRACLTSIETFQYFLFDHVSSDLYRFCTSIEVQQDDSISNALCDTCYDMLKKICQFKNTCILANNTLLSYKSINSNETCLKNEVINGESEILIETPKGEPIDIQTEHLNLETAENVTVNDNLELYDNYVEDDISDHDTISFVETPKKASKIKTRKRSNLQLGNCEMKYICEVCKRKFSSNERLKKHELTHQAQTIKLECIPCSKQFVTRSGLNRHNATWHSKISLKSMKCRICGKVALSIGSLRSHEKLHKERVYLICNICGKAYTTSVGLKIHLETHLENRERTSTCEYCGKKFFTKKTLTNHVSRCHTERRFICQICNYPFTDKYNLSQHLLLHEGKKLFKCKECEKSFASHKSLEEHKRVHSGERPFSCSYCQKSFLSKKRLTEHIRTHTGEKPHKCSVCARGFTQRGTLKRHMRVHNKMGPSVNEKYVDACV